MKKIKSAFKRHSQKIIAAILLSTAAYGGGRFYFSATDGFWVSNIVSDIPANPSREIRPFTSEESKEWAEIASQEWHYLGKGCQSYVFESEDKRYVLKFFKYQRFRTPFWLEALTFIPPIKKYVDHKMVKKNEKLAFFMQAWKVAFDELKEESGLVAVHLNKSNNLKTDFVLYDKLGFKHVVAADNVEFLIQRKAEGLVPWINHQMVQQKKERVTELLDHLIATLVSEYQRGLSDDDPALMQNTGVYHDRPFHIDVGQFTKAEHYRDPARWHQALYNKTYNFRLWLLKNYPELGEHLTHKLQSEIGEDWSTMKPFFGRIH